MPSNAPKCKIAAARRAGGDVVLCEATIEARTAAAQKHMEEHPRCTLIPPYNHPHIIAGQGTVALELLQQVSNAEVLQLGTPSHEVADDGTPGSTLGTGAEEPESDELLLDAVVVPVSGGGLISGIATAIKKRLPQCKVLSCCTVVPVPAHSWLPPTPANICLILHNMRPLFQTDSSAETAGESVDPKHRAHRQLCGPQADLQHVSHLVLTHVTLIP